GDDCRLACCPILVRGGWRPGDRRGMPTLLAIAQICALCGSAGNGATAHARRDGLLHDVDARATCAAANYDALGTRVCFCLRHLSASHCKRAFSSTPGRQGLFRDVGTLPERLPDALESETGQKPF